MRRLVFPTFLIVIALGAWCLRNFFRPATLPEGSRTVDQVLDAVGPTADKRLAFAFARAGVPYPPARLALLIFKAEKRLEVYASAPAEPYRLVSSYPILAASGAAGPKYCEGDCQVPEGFYRIESLNPNSRFHLSLRINYPNDADRARALMEGRNVFNLGGDIMIHGSDVSIGCLAMGDLAAEDLFVLAARTGLENIRVLLAPGDFRSPSFTITAKEGDETTARLYRELSAALAEFPRN
ncbi:hypothetical protein BH09VER1_BH09VER1_42360 [soil metagenome]